jgi:tripartite-type tricarboxylate transporter receptor subunit TctC
LSRRESLVRAASLLAFAAAPATASAQPGGYPTKPVKLVIPYPPGGGTDITGRAMAQKLSDFLGQSVVIENKPGATGMIGAASVAKSAPDGYTVLFGAASEMAINASLFKNMTYDPRSDFEPVTLVATFPLVFIAPATTTPSLKELIEAARAKPDTVSYGSIGSGSPQHLAAELLSSMAKAKFLHIPYKGSGPLVQDAVGGHVNMAVSSVPPAVPLVRSGKLRALAVTSSARSEALPDVPTMAELGFPGYEFNTWVGVAVPKGSPKEVVDRLRDGMVAALAASEVQATLRDQGAVPAGTTAEQFRQFVHDEVAKSDRIVSQAGIQPE